MRIIRYIIASFSLLLLPVAPAFAQGDLCPSGSGGFNALCSNVGHQTFSGFISIGVSILLLAAVVIAIVFLIWGGIKWILSGGDKAAVEGARNHVIGAIVGLVIAFLTYFIINIVLNIFGLGSITNIKLPTF